MRRYRLACFIVDERSLVLPSLTVNYVIVIRLLVDFVTQVKPGYMVVSFNWIRVGATVDSHQRVESYFLMFVPK